MKNNRIQFYKLCQDIVDDIYSRSSKGFISEYELVSIYGKEDYDAFKKEILTNTQKDDNSSNTSLIRWMYKTRYFINKIKEEKRNNMLFRVAVFSFVLSIPSFIMSLIAIIKLFLS